MYKIYELLPDSNGIYQSIGQEFNDLVEAESELKKLKQQNKNKIYRIMGNASDKIISPRYLYFVFVDNNTLYKRFFISQQAAEEFAKQHLSSYFIDHMFESSSRALDLASEYFDYTYSADKLITFSCDKADKTLRQWILTEPALFDYNSFNSRNNQSYIDEQRQYYMNKIVRDIRYLYKINIPSPNVVAKSSYANSQKLIRTKDGRYRPVNEYRSTPMDDIYMCIDSLNGIPVLVYKSYGLEQPLDDDEDLVFNWLDLDISKEQEQLNDQLIEAAKNGNLNEVQQLITQGANPKYMDSNSLQWAARNGHFAVVKYLIENGADSKDDSYNAFKWAVHNKHKQIAQYLAQYVPEHMRKFANF